MEPEEVRKVQCLRSKSGWAWVGRRRVGFGHQYFVYRTHFRAFLGIASPIFTNFYEQWDLMDAFNGTKILT